MRPILPALVVSLAHFSTQAFAAETMLALRADFGARQRAVASFLEAQARLRLGEMSAAPRLLRRVLRRAPGHPGARDLIAMERG